MSRRWSSQYWKKPYTCSFISNLLDYISNRSHQRGWKGLCGMQKKESKVSNTGDGSTSRYSIEDVLTTFYQCRCWLCWTIHYNTGEKYKKSKTILMLIHLSEYPHNTFGYVIQDEYWLIFKCFFENGKSKRYSWSNFLRQWR